MTAFETLKDKLVNPPILTLPKANRPLILDTDACDHQLGSVLLQQQENLQTWLSLGFWSRTLSSPEKNYDTKNKECLAVVWAVLSLRPYLEGTTFLIRTDQDALTWLLNLTTPSGRLLRWKLRIQEYYYDITHQPGAQHKAADALSRILTDGTDRRPLDDEVPTVNVADWIDHHEGAYGEEFLAFFNDFPDSLSRFDGEPQVYALEQDLEVQPVTKEELVREQREDPLCKRSRNDSREKHSLFEEEEDGLLVLLSPIDGARQKVVPKPLQSRFLYLAHYPLTAGHPQEKKMYDTLRT